MLSITQNEFHMISLQKYLDLKLLVCVDIQLSYLFIICLPLPTPRVPPIGSPAFPAFSFHLFNFALDTSYPPRSSPHLESTETISTMPEYTHHIAILGAGTIGLSMVALHLRRPDTRVTIYDPRPDFSSQLRSQLPPFLDSNLTIPTTQDGATNDPVNHLIATSRLTIAATLREAVTNATIIQEQSPERTDSKQALWNEVTQYVDSDVHLWSSSSGIPASAQAATCQHNVAERLLVAHPFNPPHIMPLVEIVPGPQTNPERVEFVKAYFETVPGPSSRLAIGEQTKSEDSGKFVQHYRPVVLRKEIPGFVGNRLAFALLREASYLVGEGVVSAQDLDSIVTSSLGPRWAGSGVFESYHAGGGEGGIGAFLQKLAPTVQDVWGQLGQVDILTEAERGQAGGGEEEKWRAEVVRQTEEAYGPSTTAETRAKKEIMLRNVLELQKRS